MKKLLSLFTIISIVLIGGIIFADINGVWHETKDVQGGTFGADELDVTSYYRFIHPVYFDQNIELRNATLNVTGSILLNGTTIATLDSSGKVPLEQLPFHKGDLLAPQNRQTDLGLLDTYYFDITNLAISGVSAANVRAGIKFGLNNSLTGTAICGTEYYLLLGENSPTGTNYCIKADILNLNSTIVQTAGVCKYISSCTSASQTISNYNDGTVCGSGLICITGSCVTASGSNQYTTPGTYTWTAPYAISNLRIEVAGGGGGSSGGDQSAGSAGQGGKIISGNINVNSGDILTIYVGSGGRLGTWHSAGGAGGSGFSSGGTGGFGASSGSGGGGGGSSAIVKSAVPILVGGGGGGGGGAGYSIYSTVYDPTIDMFTSVPASYYASGYTASVNGGNGVAHSGDGGGGAGGGAGYPYGGNGGAPNSGDAIGQGGVSGQSYSNPSVTSVVNTAIASNGASPSTVSSGNNGGNGYVRISWG